MLGAPSSRSSLSVLVGALFKKFGFFFKTQLVFCTGLGYVWQNAGETGIGTMCRVVETRCNDIQRQMRLVGMREMKSLCCTGNWIILLRKSGVYMVLQGERMKRHSVAQVGNLVTERVERVPRAGDVFCAGRRE
jgi:hypothetical protein